MKVPAKEQFRIAASVNETPVSKQLSRNSLPVVAALTAPVRFWLIMVQKLRTCPFRAIVPPRPLNIKAVYACARMMLEPLRWRMCLNATGLVSSVLAAIVVASAILFTCAIPVHLLRGESIIVSSRPRLRTCLAAGDPRLHPSGAVACYLPCWAYTAVLETKSSREGCCPCFSSASSRVRKPSTYAPR